MVGRAVTDSDGRYEIADLRPFDTGGALYSPPLEPGAVESAPGPQVLEVRQPGYGRQRVLYRQVPGQVDVTIHRAAVVKGQIVLDRGTRPAAGARLEFFNDMAGPDYWTRTTADDEGRYELATLPPGEYHMSVILEGRPNLFRRSVKLQSGDNKLDLRMEKGGTIRGRVIDATTGKAPKIGTGPKMGVSKSENFGSFAGMASAEVQPDGTFSMLVPAGRNHFGIYCGPDWSPVKSDWLLNKGVEVFEGKTTEITYYVTPRKK